MASSALLADYRIRDEPYYRPAGDEVELLLAAYGARLPVMLKGPTGCGKTRLVEHLAYRLGRPLVTVACHEDMTASDLVGRYLLDADGTRWQDGPLTLAARHGAICYLDEIVEARQDTTVVIHPLCDSRRCLPLDRKNELVAAHPDFLLVISYNPGYQNAAKELKPSTRQRFGAIELGYPEPDAESAIVAHEAGIGRELARRLVAFAGRTRALDGHGLEQGASTRMLIHAGRMVARGVDPLAACRLAVVVPITDDLDSRAALEALATAEFLNVPARGSVDARVAAARFARGLLGGAVDVFAAPSGTARPFAVERSFYLPERWPEPDAAAGPVLHFAATAHLAAHVRFGAGRFARKGLKPIQITLVSLLEDARVEREMLRELPGLARLWAPFHRARPDDHPTFPALCARIGRALFDPDYEDAHPVVDKARELFRAAGERPTTEACRKIGSLLGNDVGQMRLSFNAREYVVEPVYRDDHRGLWEEAAVPPTAAGEVIERYAPTREAEPEPEPEPGPETEAVAGAVGARVVHYAEWDYRIARMRADFSRVRECRAPVVVAEPTPPARDMQRRAHGLRFEALARLRRQSDGEALDLDRAIEAELDVRARRTPDPRVYARTGRRREDPCLLLLLDLSRSTGELVPGTGQSRLELARDASLLLCEALARRSTRFALHGFSSEGRRAVEYHVIKDLTQPWDRAARARLLQVEPRLSTRMGAALRHAGHHLDCARERRRLVLLITDGEPSDIDAPDPLYLLHDARKAVDELRRRGHGVFAVSLDREADHYVRRIFGRGRYAVLDRCERLPRLLPALYAKIAS